MSQTCPVCNSEIPPESGSCPACGFKLLGTTEQIQPIAVDDTSNAEKPAPGKTALFAALTVVRGPQIGTSYRLDDKQLSVGRSPQCDIFLNDMTVSRAHATIFPKDGNFVIRDCQSYNGIWINNANVDEAVLHNGDIIQIGAFCLLFEG